MQQLVDAAAHLAEAVAVVETDLESIIKKLESASVFDAKPLAIQALLVMSARLDIHSRRIEQLEGICNGR